MPVHEVNVMLEERIWRRVDLVKTVDRMNGYTLGSSG